jgi:hypothetical protein
MQTTGILPVLDVSSCAAKERKVGSPWKGELIHDGTPFEWQGARAVVGRVIAGHQS